MNLPFTREQFLEVFREYNLAVFPMQVVFYILAAIVTYLAVRTTTHSGKVISLMLAFFWLWMGIVYHILFFSAINKAAYFFGAMYVMQGVLFILYGVMHDSISFHFRKDTYGIMGMTLIVFALIAYPLLGIAAGHIYPLSPTFGLPCPTTIFTFGLMLLSDKKFPILLVIIPFLWSMAGISAALNFGMLEDWFLIIAGVITLSFVIFRNRKFNQPSNVSPIKI